MRVRLQGALSVASRRR